MHPFVYDNSFKFNGSQSQEIESIGYSSENLRRNILLSKGLYHVDVGGQGTSERLQTREPVVT